MPARPNRVLVDGTAVCWGWNQEGACDPPL